MKNLIAILIGLGFIFSLSQVALATDKNQSVKTVLSTLNQLAAKAENRSKSKVDQTDLTAKEKSEIKAILIKLDTDELTKVAIMSWALFLPGDASDQKGDEVYYDSFWRCVDILAENQTMENYIALIAIKDHSGLGAGERVVFDEVLKKFPNPPVFPKKTVGK